MNISIAMATYNGEKYVKEQLLSIAAQTLLPFELVVCDDCSSDETIKIVEEFASSAPFSVRVYRNEKTLGVTDNFMKAAQLCSGNWIAFSDQDDVWLPHKLERMCDIIRSEKSDLLLVAHSSIVADDALKPTATKNPFFKRNQVKKVRENFALYGIHGFSLLVSDRVLGLTSLGGNLPYFSAENGGRAHDSWVCMLANALGDVAYISEPLAIWRRNPGASTPDAFLNSSLRERDSFYFRIKNSLAAVNGEAYRKTAVLAKLVGLSYIALAERCLEANFKSSLLIAAKECDILHRTLILRAHLYSCNTLLGRLRWILSILLMRGYFGSDYHSLGWMSLFKDLAFASKIFH